MTGAGLLRVTVPVFTDGGKAGGLATETILLCEAVEMFLTVSTNLKPVPAAIAETGLFDRSVV